MILLMLPAYINYLMLALGILSFGGSLYLVYRIVIGPALQALADLEAPPPTEGYVYDIVIDPKERRKKVSIGQLDGTIRTHMQGIKEDHLVLLFTKDRDLEEYEISVNPGGFLLYRPPHGAKLDFLNHKESFESRELIGHPATFRLGAGVRDKRAFQYVEFELTTKFVINQLGEERMKFLLEVKRIFPGVEKESRKKGVYGFSRLKVNQESGEKDE